MSLKYTHLSDELQKQIVSDRKNHWINPYRFFDRQIMRRAPSHDVPNIWRPAFVRDTEKILHLPLYNRYTDKTQVFSFYKNDDISRRALHVQLVSRIARNIGKVLGLNVDLIEAIALGHDIGHTPFGHAGERFLNELLHSETGRYFNHNVQSVRVFDKMFPVNMSLQTLDGILCHNGEFEKQEFKPRSLNNFDEFDKTVEACYTDGQKAIKQLVPSTLEGCVVRICDIIAYLGKDRQDAQTAQIINGVSVFSDMDIGTQNAAIINNLTVDIIESSYGKNCIALSEKAFNQLSQAKKENFKYIYNDEKVNGEYNEIIRPMFYDMYYKLLDDAKKQNKNSVIYRQHIKFINSRTKYYSGDRPGYSFSDEPNQLVVDFIASMTDDYFMDLYSHMFPDSKYSIEYKSYFQECKNQIYQK